MISLQKLTLRQRLIITIGFIMLACQLFSVFWLWHESEEQIQLLVASALENVNNRSHISKEVHEAIASLLIPSLLMLLLSLILCYQSIRWLTRPLIELRHELETRTADNLNPIMLKSNVAEVEAVIAEINQLVARLTSTLDNERLFTADVAHELRTPLAGVRLHLELLGKTHQLDVAPLLQRLEQMTESVSQLLQLARVGQSFSAGNYQTVWLDQDVIQPLRAELQEMLQQRQQRLILPARAQDVAVRGDATLLRVLLRNLVENAHRYSPQGSVITVSAGSADAPMLMVEDEGDGIDETKRGDLSQAFVRMDSRYGGIGLGLSIVSRIAQLHQAQFVLQNRADTSGCQASVRLQAPAAPPVSR